MHKGPVKWDSEPMVSITYSVKTKLYIAKVVATRAWTVDYARKFEVVDLFVGQEQKSDCSALQCLYTMAQIQLPRFIAACEKQGKSGWSSDNITEFLKDIPF